MICQTIYKELITSLKMISSRPTHHFIQFHTVKLSFHFLLLNVFFILSHLILIFIPFHQFLHHCHINIDSVLLCLSILYSWCNDIFIQFMFFITYQFYYVIICHNMLNGQHQRAKKIANAHRVWLHSNTTASLYLCFFYIIIIWLFMNRCFHP